MTSFLMSSPPSSISHRLFRCRYSNSRDVVASSPSFPAPPPGHPKEHARRLYLDTFNWSQCTSGEERFKYPLPRKNKIIQMRHPSANKDSQIASVQNQLINSYLGNGVLLRPWRMCIIYLIYAWAHWMFLSRSCTDTNRADKVWAVKWALRSSFNVWCGVGLARALFPRFRCAWEVGEIFLFANRKSYFLSVISDYNVK